MDLVPRLSLNKHPKDYTNLSFVDARNVRLSDDGAVIMNEEGLEINFVILDAIQRKLKDYKIDDYKIYHIMPCNNELVIFVGTTNTPYKLYLFRYNEKDNTCILFKGELPLALNNGDCKITADFTYNVDNALIISYSIYDCGKDLPIYTINLGEWNDVLSGTNKIPNDKYTDNNKLSILPIVKIPTDVSIEYTSGKSYKGWYNFYIRFKISENNYTQWFSFGPCIHNNTLNNIEILKYCYGKIPVEKAKVEHFTGRLFDCGYARGFSDYISSNNDICDTTLKLNINFWHEYDNKDDSIGNDRYFYNEFQVGYVVANKIYSKAFRSDDIKIQYKGGYSDTDPNITYSTLTLDVINIDYDINDFIETYSNYYNVKNIVNYKNRLYISNYKEQDINKDLNDIVKDIKIGLKVDNSNYEYLKLFNDIIEEHYCTTLKTFSADIEKNWHLKYVNDVRAINETGKTQIQNGVSYTQIPLHEFLNLSGEDPEKRYVRVFRDTSTEGIFGYIVVKNGKSLMDQTGEFKYKHKESGNEYIISFTGKSYKYNDGTSSSTFGDWGSPFPSYPVAYIDTNKSFIDRQLNSSLIPGEIYNFYIHFIDKYGQITNGYKLTNHNNEVIIDINDGYLYLIPSYYKISENKRIKRIEKSKVSIDGFKLIYNNDNTIDVDIPKKLKDKYNDFISDDKYKNLYWCEIINDYVYNMFNIYINSEGDDLFRVPDIYDSNYIINIKIKDVTIPDGYVGYFISYESPEKLVKHTGVLCKSDFIPYNVIDDGGADGKYFISKNVNIDHYNNNMHFYSSNLDITDKLDLNVDYIKIISKNSWAAAYNKSSLALYPSKCKYIHSENIPYINNHNINEIFKINNLELNVANDITNDRFGKGTSISMKAYNELFPNSIIKENKYQITQYNIYLALLIQFNNNIYTKNIKKLLRISPIFYNTKDRIIRKHFHSYKTYNSAIIYSNEGVLFNDADNTVRRITDNSLYFDPTNWAPWYRSKKDSKINTSFYKIDMDFVKYFQFICYDYMFNEDKSFLNKPNNIIFNIFTNPNTKALDGKDGAVEQPINTFAIGKMITPANSIDLFQNIQGESINHITTSYTNYNKNNINKLSYDKTIRRSSVIRDESRENSWRKFGLESYKNITENKGKITKLIGIGTLFLVHTEHSLFMFDMDNSLKTNNKEIQLYSPDTFEVQYKEIFTSNLGFGGLQDKESSIVDQFGYIFYDTDKSIFYRYDAGKLNMISEDIQLWLNKFKPVNVRFANDKKHNRLLISFDYSDKNTVLSYNYKSNTFISIHDIDFKFGVNTKNKLYLLHDYGSRISTEIYNQLLSNFGNNYNISYKYNGTPTKQIYTESSISIIINSEYTINKFLEHITYRFNKIDTNKEKDQIDSPVEGTTLLDPNNSIITPYSGYTIRIYNDYCDTGVLNILVNNENTKNNINAYQKPYWELGNWNFNYIRNMIKQYGVNKVSDDLTRMFGNYFVIQFIFNNDKNRESNYRYEFEDFDYKLTKNKIG